MNSFKKIAFALVAAMGMSLIIATPASAAVSTTLTVGSTSVSATLADPALLPVPEANTVVDDNVLEIAMSGLEAGTTASAVATNGKIVTALATASTPVAANAGSSSASVNTGTGTTATFYVFTTNVSSGTVVVSYAGTTTTYYFKGVAGTLNSIALVTPDTVASGTTQKVTVAGYDVFGNAKGGATINLQVVTTTSTTSVLTTETETAGIKVLGAKTVDVAFPTSGVVTIIATATVATEVAGLTKPVSTVVKTVAIRDLAAELAATQAALSSEKAARAADKVAADKALADEKTAHEATKAALATATAQIAALNASITKLRSWVNALKALVKSLRK